jgi:hypothetical protein
MPSFTMLGIPPMEVDITMHLDAKASKIVFGNPSLSVRNKNTFILLR